MTDTQPSQSAALQDSPTVTQSPNSTTSCASYVDIGNARYDDQRKVMESIQSAKHCPFCTENLKLYHKQPILHDGEFWVVTPNQWPYKHTKVHLLCILKEHAETLQELPPGAGEELLSLCAQFSQEYNAPGGGVALRFGDTRYSAGTVKHLHAQFIVPDIDAVAFEPVRVKIGSKKQSISSHKSSATT